MRRALAVLMLVGTTSALAAIALGAGKEETAPGGWPAAERAAKATTRRTSEAGARRRARRSAGAGPGRGAARRRTAARPLPHVVWRASTPLGTPTSGALVRGVELPVRGAHFATWDPVRKRTPNRWWRRYGTDKLVRVLLRVTRQYARAHPRAPRVLIGDLSRPRGGDFGRRYGPLGHVSHQNGLDADVYYPRRDRRLRAPRRPAQVDRALAQDLVDRFVRAGARLVLVGPSLGLRGPRGVVLPYPHHDDHVHVRL